MWMPCKNFAIKYCIVNKTTVSSFTDNINASKLITNTYLAIVGSSWKIVGVEVGGAGLPPFLELSRSIAPLDMIFFIGESVLTAGPRRAYTEYRER